MSYLKYKILCNWRMKLSNSLKEIEEMSPQDGIDIEHQNEALIFLKELKKELNFFIEKLALF